MAYFTLNMCKDGEHPAARGLDVIKDMSSTNLSSDMSTATSLAADAAQPPAARECAASAPALLAGRSATPPAPANTPEISALSECGASIYSSKGSPFVSGSVSWAAKLAKDADHLAASINVASAVHTPEPVLQPVRRSGSNVKRRMCPPVGAAHPPLHTMLTPRLSAHTSMLLKASLNPLEEALSEDLANSDLPILFLHGVGGIPAYLEMLLQVSSLG